MPSALVTGGAGFIGSHIARTLLRNGWKVRILDDFSTGKRENLPESVANLEVQQGDIREAAALDEAVRDVDCVFHEAAFVSVPQSLAAPGNCFSVNVQGTQLLLEAAHRAGVQRVVMASSAAVYGDNPTMPLAEDAELRSLSPYAASKRMDEVLAELYTRSMGLEVIALRYFNVYGPRQSPESDYAAAVPHFIRSLLQGKPVTIYGDGAQTRDMIYVADVVRANLLAAQASDFAGLAFNVCTGQETRLLDLVRELQELLPGAPEPNFTAAREGDIYRSLGSPSRAEARLGFRAETSLSDGLKETVAWMRDGSP
jgi:UDP-glucose 4-epimerase